MQQPSLIATGPRNLEVWQTYDESAGVFELWSNSNCASYNYLGYAYTRQGAYEFACEWLRHEP